MSRRFMAFVFGLVLVVACSPTLAAVNVLFDASHAQTVGNADWVIDEDSCGVAQRYPTPSQANVTGSTPETYWSGAFSAFGIALVKHGYHVESLPSGASLTYGDTSNAQDLTHYDVLVLPEPNVPFTDAEKQAILNFVENGGGLFMISDHAGADRNNDGWDAAEVFNDLGSEAYFGIHFNVNTESDSWFNDHPDDRYTNDPNSPIVHGLYGDCSSGKGLGLYGATSMTLHPANNSTVTGEIWKTDGTVGATTKVTFAVAEYGQGRVAAIGDSSPAEDATNTCGHTTHDGWGASAYDNALIHLNAIAWLAGSGSGGTSGGGGGTPTERISDGTFEGGLYGSSNTGSSGTTGPWSWTSTGSNNPISEDSSRAEHGSWLAWLNGYGKTETDTVQQSVAIPSDATTATFKFDLKVVTNDGTSTAYDKLYVYLIDGSGTSHTLATYSNKNAAASGYVTKSFNVLDYAGQTVTIKFKGSEDSSNSTSFYIDDVSLMADSGSTPPPSTYSLSGTVTENGSGLSGVTVTAGSKSATTSASGSYTISGLADGTYTVTPSKSGYTFSPSSQSVTISGANKTGIDFTATASGGGGGTPTERISDGTFEGGLYGSSNTGSSGTTGPWSWTSTGSNNPISQDSSRAEHGSWLAWLNGYGQTETDTVQQSVAIPSGATTATFTFDLKVVTNDGTSTAYDKLYVYLIDGSGTSHTLATYSNKNAATSSYVTKSFNVLDYAGQTVTIKFKGSEDVSNSTSFYIDDVSLMADGN